MKRRYIGAAMAAVCALAPALVAGGAVAAEVPFLKAQEAGEWLTYRLVGTKVLNSKGDIIGEVRDVVLDTNGMAKAVVIGVGGFAGIADKRVAVPFKSIYIGDVAHSSRVVVLDVTKEQLLAAPAYEAKDPTAADRLKAKASDWAKVAKEKAAEWSKAAAEKAKELQDGAKTPPAPSPAPATPPQTPPVEAPKQ